MEIADSIYPITVTSDRYDGSYSGYMFTAWNLDPFDVPIEIYADDITCRCFWEKNKIPFGGGRTIEEAVGNLYIRLKQEESNA